MQVQPMRATQVWNSSSLILTATLVTEILMAIYYLHLITIRCFTDCGWRVSSNAIMLPWLCNSRLIKVITCSGNMILLLVYGLMQMGKRYPNHLYPNIRDICTEVTSAQKVMTDKQTRGTEIAKSIDDNHDNQKET